MPVIHAQGSHRSSSLELTGVPSSRASNFVSLVDIRQKDTLTDLRSSLLIGNRLFWSRRVNIAGYVVVGQGPFLALVPHAIPSSCMLKSTSLALCALSVTPFLVQ